MKRLAFGRIVGRQVKMKRTGEVGSCVYYDRVERVFIIALDSRKNKYNPEGVIECLRDDFEII